MPKVSIIILTYNSSSHILNLIKSIRLLSTDQNNTEIIIADNLSTDDTASKISSIKHQIPNIKLIENGQNLGFAAGINKAVIHAKGEFLLFINPDTRLEKGNLNDLTSVFDKFDKVGIVGGKLIDKNGKEEKSTGRFFGLFEIILMSFGLDEILGLRSSPKEIKKVDFVSGGFMIVKKDLFDKLSGFDEKFFMYLEDVDLCFRAKKKGFLTYFTPNIIFTHESHGSSSRAFAIKNIYKGILYYSRKNNSLASYILIKLILFLKAAFLVLIGRMLNNKYLAETYLKAIRI